MSINSNDITHKNIALTGFMGVGKTTVAQLLAKRLKRTMIDTDEEIEKQMKLPTTEIFAKYGETTFRQKEKDVILHYCKQHNLILSLGGGAFLQQEVRHACLEHCSVVFLDISWENWQKRVPRLKKTRPLLQQRSLQEIMELFEERKAIYAHHHIKINTDGLEPEDVVANIVHVLKEE